MRRRATGLRLYDAVAQETSATVLTRYSSSFGLASRLLGPRVRRHVRNVYALVRVADEIVDGPAADAGLSAARTRRTLDFLESETLGAVDEGFSANLVVHSFALTARSCGIDARLVRPFFASMRTDLSRSEHDDASREEYVYGSAEVVGLMCLRVFLNAGPALPVEPPDDLAEGARRLGAAFQEINFLRDLHHDAETLGRDYLALTDAARRIACLDRIDADLATARACIPALPRDCRPAVRAAHDLFASLSGRLRRTDADGRVRVPDIVKASIAARAALRLPDRHDGSTPAPA